jgi:hypothetical protein
VWVKYARYGECVWPGEVEELIDDETEALMCKQQALEGRMPSKSDAELDGEKVYRIAWFNHYTSRDEKLLRTENEFLGCEVRCPALVCFSRCYQSFSEGGCIFCQMPLSRKGTSTASLTVYAFCDVVHRS